MLSAVSNWNVGSVLWNLRARLGYLFLEHLSNWFVASASWRTAFLLDKMCSSRAQTTPQIVSAIVDFSSHLSPR